MEPRLSRDMGRGQPLAFPAEERPPLLWHRPQEALLASTPSAPGGAGYSPAAPPGGELATIEGALGYAAPAAWGTFEKPFSEAAWAQQFDPWESTLIDPTQSWDESWDDYMGAVTAEKQAAQQMMMQQANRMGLGTSGLGAQDWLGAGMQFAQTIGGERTKHEAAKNAAIEKFNQEQDAEMTALKASYENYFNDNIMATIENQTGQGMQFEGYGVNPLFEQDVQALQKMLSSAKLTPEDGAQMLEDLYNQWNASGYLYVKTTGAGVHYGQIGFGSKSALKQNQWVAEALGYQSVGDWVSHTGGGYLRPGDSVTAPMFSHAAHLEGSGKSWDGGQEIAWA